MVGLLAAGPFVAMPMVAGETSVSATLPTLLGLSIAFALTTAIHAQLSGDSFLAQ